MPAGRWVRKAAQRPEETQRARGCGARQRFRISSTHRHRLTGVVVSCVAFPPPLGLKSTGSIPAPPRPCWNTQFTTAGHLPTLTSRSAPRSKRLLSESWERRLAHSRSPEQWETCPSQAAAHHPLLSAPAPKVSSSDVQLGRALGPAQPSFCSWGPQAGRGLGASLQFLQTVALLHMRMYHIICYL